MWEKLLVDSRTGKKMAHTLSRPQLVLVSGEVIPPVVAIRTQEVWIWRRLGRMRVEDTGCRAREPIGTRVGQSARDGPDEVATVGSFPRPLRVVQRQQTATRDIHRVHHRN